MREIDEFIWSEKYRPSTIDECILPEELKKTFKSMVKNKQVQNMLLAGQPGTGKTTVARALCNELNCEIIFINASDENGIDTLRTKMMQFASTVSFEGKQKVIILDEADYLNANSIQPAMRSFIEQYSSNCRFILTANNKNRIIPALHSRLSVIDFRIEDDEIPDMAEQIYERLAAILKEENIKYKNNVLVGLVEKYFPDFRKMINELQIHSKEGKLSLKVLSELDDSVISELRTYLKDKDWFKMRQWVADNISNDVHMIFNSIYDMIIKEGGNSIPELIVLIGEYQYKSAFVANQEINMVAFLTEMMGTIDLK